MLPVFRNSDYVRLILALLMLGTTSLLGIWFLHLQEPVREWGYSTSPVIGWMRWPLWAGTALFVLPLGLAIRALVQSQPGPDRGLACRRIAVGVLYLAAAAFQAFYLKDLGPDRVETVMASPDGRSLAYVLEYYRLNRNRPHHLWVYQPETRERTDFGFIDTDCLDCDQIIWRTNASLSVR